MRWAILRLRGFPGEQASIPSRLGFSRMAYSDTTPRQRVPPALPPYPSIYFAAKSFYCYFVVLLLCDSRLRFPFISIPMGRIATHRDGCKPHDREVEILRLVRYLALAIHIAISHKKYSTRDFEERKKWLSVPRSQTPSIQSRCGFTRQHLRM